MTSVREMVKAGQITETPWLDVMRSRLGTQEIPGEGGDNPIILGWFKAIGHPEIRHDEVGGSGIVIIRYAI